MTRDEVRKLLAPYADGMLAPELAREVEAALLSAPELQAEYKSIQETNDLLFQALQPLQPSQSTRIRVSEAMQDEYQRAMLRAQQIDRSIADKKFRITGLLMILTGLGVLFIISAAVFYKMRMDVLKKKNAENKQPSERSIPAKASAYP
jgi:anti-sigma factor RsiW